jgi:hypothetical protein
MLSLPHLALSVENIVKSPQTPGPPMLPLVPGARSKKYPFTACALLIFDLMTSVGFLPSPEGSGNFPQVGREVLQGNGVVCVSLLLSSSLMGT